MKVKVRGFLRNKVWNPIKNNWRWTFTFCLVCLFVIGFVEALKGDPAFATALLAFATLLLAVFAAWSIDETRKREKRDRKERLLNEIIEWAVDVSKRASDINFLLLAAEIDEEPWGGLNLPTLQSSLRELKQRGEYVVKVAGSLEKPLLTAVQKVEDEVTQYLKAMDSIFIQVRLGSLGNLPEILKPLLERASFVSCANELLAEAAKVKTEDIG